MKKLITLAGLLMVCATPAFAHGNSGSGWVDHFFREADTDGNGTVSKDEYLDYYEKKFDKMDTNNDGELSKSEMMAAKKSEMKMHHNKHAMMKNAPATQDAGDDQDRVDTSNDAKTNSKNGSDNGK